MDHFFIGLPAAADPMDPVGLDRSSMEIFAVIEELLGNCNVNHGNSKTMVIVKITDFVRIMGYPFFFFEMGASRIMLHLRLAIDWYWKLDSSISGGWESTDGV